MLTYIGNNKRVVGRTAVYLFNKKLRIYKIANLRLNKRTAEGFNLCLPVAVVKLLNSTGKLGNKLLKVAAKVIIRIDILIHLGSVDINMQNFRIRRKLRPVTRYTVGETRTASDKYVAVVSGFVTLNWIFGHLLGLPYRALIVFLAFLAAFTMYKYLERNSYSPLLGAVTMYICLLSGNAYLSAIRRSTAMNFILFAYMAMMDKNRLKAALLILFAMTMHRSAIIIFLFLPFIDTKITRDLCRKIIVIIFAAGLIAVPVASRMLPIVLGWFGKASYFYGASGWLNSGARLEVKAVAGIVALLAIYFFLDFRLLNTAENNMLCKIFLFVIIFSPIQRIVPLLGDIYMYFTPSCYLLVENLIVQRKEDVFIKRMMQLTSLIVMAAVFSTRVEPLRNSYPQPTSGHYRTIWTSSSGR